MPSQYILHLFSMRVQKVKKEAPITLKVKAKAKTWKAKKPVLKDFHSQEKKITPHLHFTDQDVESGGSPNILSRSPPGDTNLTIMASSSSPWLLSWLWRKRQKHTYVHCACQEQTSDQTSHEESLCCCCGQGHWADQAWWREDMFNWLMAMTVYMLSTKLGTSKLASWWTLNIFIFKWKTSIEQNVMSTYDKNSQQTRNGR